MPLLLLLFQEPFFVLCGCNPFNCLFYMYCRLASPNPRTYIGSGKVAEIKSAIHALDIETVIFDDELSPG